MKNSWLFKLLGAFLLIVAVGSVVIAILTSSATQSAFTLYTTRSGQVWAERLAPSIADYYSLNNSWQGIDVYIQEILGDVTSLGGNTTGMGHGSGGGKQSGYDGMMGALGQRVVLTNIQGIVVYDTNNELTNKQLSTSELENGTTILVNDVKVGTLLVTPEQFSEMDTAAAEFLASVRTAIISSAVIAGLIALLLGTILSIQITAPMRKLRKAAAAIANGDLQQRVDIKSKDEFGELGGTFNAMAKNLSEAETQRQHLMADVAHELRNPLTAIQGTLEAMQDGVLPCNGEQLDALYSETLLLNRLIGDLRLLSLAESSQLKLELQETDLNGLIQQIVDRAHPQAITKSIHLDTKFQTNLPNIDLDPDRITQVLNNLISNALRYTPEDGTILVQTSRTSVNEPVCVSISDTGPGIEPSDLPFVFDRFYRADKSRSRASGGSGLGLAIVKELVEAHGGSVRVESPIDVNSVGKHFGTRFILEFNINTNKLK